MERFFRTGYRMVIAELGYSATQGRNTVLRVTVYPHPTDVLNVMEFLHQPEMFIFEAAVIPTKPGAI